MDKKEIEPNIFLEEILKDARVPEEIGLKRCIQCGNCSASCPAARYTSYRPRKIIQEILIGEKNSLLEHEDIWLCYSCFSCNLRCPRDNNPGVIIHVLRDMALREGHGLENVCELKLYLESLRDFGLGLTPQSVPIKFFQDLEDELINLRENMVEILRELNMQPKNPRELPKEAKEQIKKMLELAGINEDIKRFGKKDKIKIEQNKSKE